MRVCIIMYPTELLASGSVSSQASHGQALIRLTSLSPAEQRPPPTASQEMKLTIPLVQNYQASLLSSNAATSLLIESAPLGARVSKHSKAMK